MLDLILAICHHLLVFCIFGVLLIEFVLVRPGLTVPLVRYVARIDLSYGVMAGMVVLVGFARAIWAAKGWNYYSHNVFFWSKLAVFLVIGLISTKPTIVFLGWRKANQAPVDTEVIALRRLLWVELALFALLPAFAAAMARGYGQLPR